MSAQIVWLASFPKSGNTWFRMLLANWLAAGDQPVGINNLKLGGNHLVTREAFDGATLLDSGLLQPGEVDRLRPAVNNILAAEAEGAWYVKTHEAYRRNADGEPLLGGAAVRAAIYLVRDPRDIASSLARHFDTSLERAIAILNSPHSALAAPPTRQSVSLPQLLLGWSGHAASWLVQSDVPVHLLRYEDLKADTPAAFRRALEFLGEPADALRLDGAVRHSSFGELQRQEQAGGFRERVSAVHPFFRRGGAGAWRDDLSPEQVQQIEATHRGMMERLGYLPATGAVSTAVYATGCAAAAGF